MPLPIASTKQCVFKNEVAFELEPVKIERRHNIYEYFVKDECGSFTIVHIQGMFLVFNNI